MDAFKAHDNVISDYKSYLKSFINIKKEIFKFRTVYRFFSHYQKIIKRL